MAGSGPKANNDTNFSAGGISSQAVVYEAVGDLLGAYGGQDSIPLESEDNETPDASNASYDLAPVNVDTFEISQQVKLRPEILLLTKFNPLYDVDGKNTEHAELFEVYLNNLRLLESKSNELLKNLLGKDEIKKRNLEFKNKLFELSNNLFSLQNYIKRLNSVKIAFNHKDDRFNFFPNNFIEENKDIFSASALQNLTSLYNVASSGDIKTNLIKALSDTGRFSIDELENFSFSKLYLAALQELKFCILSLPYKTLPIQVKGSSNSSLTDALYLLPDFTDDYAKRVTLDKILDDLKIKLDPIKGKDFSGLEIENLSIFRPPASSDFEVDILKQCSNILIFCLKELQQKFAYQQLSQPVEDAPFEYRRSLIDTGFGTITTSKSLDAFAKEYINASKFSSGQRLTDLVCFSKAYLDAVQQPNVDQCILMLENNTNLVSKDLSTVSNTLFVESFFQNFVDEKLTKINIQKANRLKTFMINYLESQDGAITDNLINLGPIPVDVPNSDFSSNPLLFFQKLKETFLIKKQSKLVFKSLPIKQLQKSIKSVDDYNSYFIKQYVYNSKQNKLDKINLSVESPTKPGKFDGDTFIAIFCAIANLKKEDQIVLLRYLYKYCAAHARIPKDTLDKSPEQYDADPNIIATNFYDGFINALKKANFVPEIPYNTTKSVQYIVATRTQLIAEIKFHLQNSPIIKNIIQIMKFFVNPGKVTMPLDKSAKVPYLVDELDILGNCSHLLPSVFYSLWLYIRHTSKFDIVSFYKPVSVKINFNDNTSIEYNNPSDSVSFFQFLINENEPDLSIEINSMINHASMSTTVASNLTLAFIHTSQIIKKAVNSYELLLKEETDFIDYLLEHLNNDRQKLALLFQEPQLTLLLSNAQDLYKSYDNFSVENLDKDRLFIKNEDNIPHSSAMVEILRKFFKLDAYRNLKGYNKQIISVGIPAGLFKSLNNAFKSKNSINGKENDIFNICIYKMDLTNPLLIYKPQKFIFEASRFPVRIYSELKNVGKDDGYEVLPTRNYQLFTDYSFSVAGNVEIGTNLENSFGSDYDGIFTSENHKSEILLNHNRSFLLENYLKLMSGLNANEMTFNLVDTKEAEELYEQLYDKSLISTLKSLGVSNPFPYRVFTDKYIEKMLRPKKFDRVFNIIFDPEFEVDYDATKDNLNNNLKSNLDVLLNDKSKFILDAGVYRDVDKTPDDIEMNSYFVTVETYSEPEPYFNLDPIPLPLIPDISKPKPKVEIADFISVDSIYEYIEALKF